MQSEDLSATNFPVFCEYNKTLDKERNQSMKQMLFEWHEVLNGT